MNVASLRSHGIAACAAILQSTLVWGGNVSEGIHVAIETDKSSFWRTALTDMIEVPIVYQNGATSATLVVSSGDYICRYENITEESVVVDLPDISKPSDENVYDLCLRFDNEDERHAKVARVAGVSNGSEVDSVRMRMQSEMTTAWRKVKGRAVMPIPYGVTSFTMNGVTVDTGLEGAQGWYAYVVGDQRAKCQFVISDGHDSACADIIGVPLCWGMSITVR